MKTKKLSIHKTYFIVIISLVLLFSACKKKESNVKTIVEDTIESKVTTLKKIKIALNSKNETNATGVVIFKDEDDNVTITAIVSGLSPGEHPIYIQEQNTEINTAFIGNLIADENGNGTILKTSELFCVGCGDSAKDILGKILVIYSEADKAKISCIGVIE